MVWHNYFAEIVAKIAINRNFWKKYAPISCHLTNQIVFSLHDSSLSVWRGHNRKMITLFKKNLRDSFSLYYTIAVVLSILLLLIAII